MTQAENARLGALERRVQSAYSNAMTVATRRNNRAIARLAAVKIDPKLTGVARENAVRSAMYRAEAADSLMQNIAHELSVTRTTADRMIRGESLSLFEGAYRTQLNEIRGQVRDLGISADFRQPLKTPIQTPSKYTIMEQSDADEQADDNVWSRHTIGKVE